MWPATRKPRRCLAMPVKNGVDDLAETEPALAQALEDQSGVRVATASRTCCMLAAGLKVQACPCPALALPSHARRIAAEDAGAATTDQISKFASVRLAAPLDLPSHSACNTNKAGERVAILPGPNPVSSGHLHEYSPRMLASHLTPGSAQPSCYSKYTWTGTSRAARRCCERGGSCGRTTTSWSL